MITITCRISWMSPVRLDTGTESVTLCGEEVALPWGEEEPQPAAARTARRTGRGASRLSCGVSAEWGMERQDERLLRLPVEVEVLHEVAEDRFALADVRSRVRPAVGARVDPLVVEEV